MTQHPGARCIKEMGEFSTFCKSAQRYIKASLEIAFPDEDSDPIGRWSRNESEVAELRARTKIYATLPRLRNNVPKPTNLPAVDDFIGPLVKISGYDLGREKLTTFQEYRFLYERLVGVKARPFLPAVFLAAAALPTIQPRQRINLLQTILVNEIMTYSWSAEGALFLPEWVDKA